MSPELPPISKADYYLQEDQTRREMNRDLGFINDAKKKADEAQENFVHEASKITPLDIVKLLIGLPGMLNLILSALVAILPSIFDYVTTNGLSWKSVLLGAAGAIIAYLSPSPKSSNDHQ